MNTKTPTSKQEEVTQLTALVDQGQKLRAAYHAATDAPKKELEQLESDRRSYLQEINVKLEADIEQLKSKAQVDSALDPNKSRREKLQQMLRGREETFRKKLTPLSEATEPLLENLSLEDTMLFLPDEVRPNIIHVLGEKKPMYIVQHKLVPQCAFLVYGESTGTKWKLVVNTGVFRREYSLVCFCNSGCMTTNEYPQLIAKLNTMCREHGITHLFGRKVYDQKGINILDGGYFGQTWRTLCPAGVPQRLKGQLYLDE